MSHGKYQKLVLEGSQDGVNWQIVEPREYKKGDLIEDDSSDCGGAGEGVKYRWVTVVGEFICINNDKYTVIKKQVYNNGTWEDVTPIETTYGELVEAKSGYCGYGEYWADTERWECASVSDMHTTKVTCYGGGSCYWSYDGHTGMIGGEYWIDTQGASVTLTAKPIDSIRKPLKYMMVDGESKTNTTIQLAGTLDHVVSMYFCENSLYNIAAGENVRFITSNKPPFKAEKNETVTITASSIAPAVGGGGWGFDHWSVGYDYVNYEPTRFVTYFDNPLKFVVTDDCRVDLYYKNEEVKTGYTLKYNGSPEVEIENQVYLRPSIWFFSSTWFIENWFKSIETKANVSPNTLRFIASSCFTDESYGSWASKLNSVNFPTVEVVYGSAFTGLSFLYSLSLPNVNTIYNDAFKSCIRLSTVSFPNVEYIGARAFMGCTSLQRVYLFGSSVCSLEGTNGVPKSQFYNCPNLKSIIVPASLYYSYKNTWGSYSGLIYAY